MTPPRPDPNFVRLHSDGELSPEQLAQWEQYLLAYPEERAALDEQVAAEAKLRRCVQRVMRETPAAPHALRTRIRAALDQAESSTRAAAASHRARWRLPQRANALAVAATLAIIAGAVLFGIFGRTIDDVVRPSTDLVADIARFADAEHSVRPRVENSSPREAEAALSEWLGAPVVIFDLSEAGYRFVGAGEVKPPVPAKSLRLVYRRIAEAGEPSPMLSIFIVRSQGGCRKLCDGMERGKWCCMTDRGVKCKRRVLRATDGELVYFLVCCDDRDTDRVAQHIQLVAARP